MTDRPGEEVVWGYFEFSKEPLRDIAARFVDDPDAVIDEARANLAAFMPDMAYLDNPRHPMA